MPQYKSIKLSLVVEKESFGADDFGFIGHIHGLLDCHFGKGLTIRKIEGIGENAPTTKDQGGD